MLAAALLMQAPALAGGPAPPPIHVLNYSGNTIHSSARAVNNLGQIAGFARTDDFNEHALIWDQSGAREISASSIPGGLSRVLGINDSGVAVGARSAADGSPRAFVWDAASGLHDLGAVLGGGGQYSFAQAINNAGQVAGQVRRTDGSTRGFVWSPADGVRILEPLAGGAYSVAYGINSLGQVVGTASTPAGTLHAVLWDPVSGLRDLGTLTGGQNSVALGTNGAGRSRVIARTQRAPSTPSCGSQRPACAIWVSCAAAMAASDKASTASAKPPADYCSPTAAPMPSCGIPPPA